LVVLREKLAVLGLGLEPDVFVKNINLNNQQAMIETVRLEENNLQIK